MEITKLAVMILVGGMIGYITNKIAIKMLFRPINPKKIVFFTIQGVFPKNKDQMAVSLADTIEKELLNTDTILDQLLNEENTSKLKEVLIEKIASKIQNAIPPMAKMFLGDNVDQLIQKFIDKDGDQLFNELIAMLKEKGKDAIDIRSLVKERIDTLDFVEFERIIFGLMNRELRHIEVIGLVLGSLIGLIQYFITTFI